MTRHILRILTAALALTGFYAMAQAPPARSTIDELLATLRSDRLDASDLWKLESQPTDSRTIPALKAAFQSRTEKGAKQRIAATLLRLGERAGPYFDFLAGYATEAIEDRTPSFIKYDSSGHSVRGQFSAAFENWCAQNAKDMRAVAAIQIHDYPEDLLMLAQADDPRARDLFRRGLESPNELVVAFSVQGLGRLQDIAALPLIAKALQDLPVDARNAVALQLPWFERPEADGLMERLLPDPKLRDYVTSQIRQQRLIEIKRVLSRTGSTTQK
jgi:HEAT repeat protein